MNPLHIVGVIAGLLCFFACAISVMINKKVKDLLALLNSEEQERAKDFIQKKTKSAKIWLLVGFISGITFLIISFF